MVRVAAKATSAGVKLSTMILLGAGGAALSEAHARASAAVITQIQPRYLSTLAMMPVEGTPLFKAVERGEYVEMAPAALARELRTFLAHLDLTGTIFRSNHASNYLALAGTLPKDKGRLLAELDAVLADPGHAAFRAAWQRGL
jgi:hypothetical protein